MTAPKVGIKQFQRMAARNLTLRGVVLDDLDDEQAKVDAVALAYEDETTRIPINRAARRSAMQFARRLDTEARHRAWYRAEADHRNYERDVRAWLWAEALHRVKSLAA